MTAVQTRADAADPVVGPAGGPVGGPVGGRVEAAHATEVRRTDVSDLESLPTGRNRRRSRWRLPRGAERLAGVVVLFAFWELASRAGWVEHRDLPAPSSLLSTARDLFREGTLRTAIWASLQRVLWGLAFGVPIGTALALVAGLWRVGDDVVDANVQMLRFVPIIALQPLLILWLGIGETVKVFLIVIGVVFPIYVNTSAAIRSIHPGYRELAKVVGLGRLRTVRRVVLPGALAGFLVGLRLAMAIAWLLLVFAEQINATSGIGYMMNRAQVVGRTDIIFVGVVVYAALGLLSDALIRGLERVLLRWEAGR